MDSTNARSEPRPRRVNASSSTGRQRASAERACSESLRSPSMQKFAHRRAVISPTEFPQIRQAETAPRCPQNCQPRSTVSEICQGRSQCFQIANQRTIRKPIGFHCAKIDSRRMERLYQLRQVSSRAHQYGNRGRLLAGRRRDREFALNAFRQMLRLTGTIRVGETPDLHRRTVKTRTRRLRLCILNRIGQVAVLTKNQRENAVEPLDQILLRTKVLTEPVETMLMPANTFGARLLIDRNVGLTKCVDRLHWIADIKSGTLFIRLPCTKQTGQEFDLDTVCVLEFVDENMADSIPQLQAQLGWVALVPDSIERALSVLGKVDGGLLRENNFKIRRSQRQYLKNSMHELPLRFRVMGIGQTANSIQRRAEFFRAGQLRKVREKFKALLSTGFLAGRSRRKTVADVHRFAQRRIAPIRGQQKITDSSPTIKMLGGCGRPFSDVKQTRQALRRDRNHLGAGRNRRNHWYGRTHALRKLIRRVAHQVKHFRFVCAVQHRLNMRAHEFEIFLNRKRQRRFERTSEALPLRGIERIRTSEKV